MPRGPSVWHGATRQSASGLRYCPLFPFVTLIFLTSWPGGTDTSVAAYESCLSTRQPPRTRSSNVAAPTRRITRSRSTSWSILTFRTNSSPVEHRTSGNLNLFMNPQEQQPFHSGVWPAPHSSSHRPQTNRPRRGYRSLWRHLSSLPSSANEYGHSHSFEYHRLAGMRQQDWSARPRSPALPPVCRDERPSSHRSARRHHAGTSWRDSPLPRDRHHPPPPSTNATLAAGCASVQSLAGSSNPKGSGNADRLSGRRAEWLQEILENLAPILWSRTKRLRHPGHLRLAVHTCLYLRSPCFRYLVGHGACGTRERSALMSRAVVTS